METKIKIFGRLIVRIYVDFTIVAEEETRRFWFYCFKNTTTIVFELLVDLPRSTPWIITTVAAVENVDNSCAANPGGACGCDVCGFPAEAELLDQ